MINQTCIYTSIAISHKKVPSLIHIACPSLATAHGYCTTHQYAARLLDKARYYGCPELLPTRKNEKTKEYEGLIIRQGLHNWQAYCAVVTSEHARDIERRLDETYGHLFRKVGVA